MPGMMMPGYGYDMMGMSAMAGMAGMGAPALFASMLAKLEGTISIHSSYWCWNGTVRGLGCVSNVTESFCMLLHCMAGLPGMGMVPGMGVCGSERCNNSEKMERSIKGPDDHWSSPHDSHHATIQTKKAGINSGWACQLWVCPWSLAWLCNRASRLNLRPRRRQHNDRPRWLSGGSFAFMCKHGCIITTGLPASCLQEYELRPGGPKKAAVKIMFNLLCFADFSCVFFVCERFATIALQVKKTSWHSSWSSYATFLSRMVCHWSSRRSHPMRFGGVLLRLPEHPVPRRWSAWAGVCDMLYHFNLWLW